MEVILREHVDNLGRRGEIVKVADGYARNFLLPRKLALLATEGNKKHIERERGKLDAKEADEKRVAEAQAERIAHVEAVIPREVGEAEALHGSVAAATASMRSSLRSRRRTSCGKSRASTCRRATYVALASSRTISAISSCRPIS